MADSPVVQRTLGPMIAVGNTRLFKQFEAAYLACTEGVGRVDVAIHEGQVITRDPVTGEVASRPITDAECGDEDGDG